MRKMKSLPGRRDSGSHEEKKFAALTVLSMIFFVGCAAQNFDGTPDSDQAASEPVQTEFFAMDTVMTFTAYGKRADQAIEDARETIRRLESRWSVTDENSEIYQVNHSGGQTVTLSDETAQIVQFALEMAEQTQGDLDPTIYPILTAWGFTTDENRIPGAEEVQKLLDYTGYEKVMISGNQIQMDDGKIFHR